MYLCSYVSVGCWAQSLGCPPLRLDASDGAEKTSPGLYHLQPQQQADLTSHWTKRLRY